jgi:hypothetical protein
MQGAFFDTVVNLYQNLTTYDWLAAAGILPDSTKTWTYTQLTSALKAHYGFTPSFDCESINQVYQVSYYYSLIGRPPPMVIFRCVLTSDSNRLCYRWHISSEGRSCCRFVPQHGHPVPAEEQQRHDDFN